MAEHPPYTREKAEDLKKQALEMGENTSRKRKVVRYLTGVITDEEAIKDIEVLLSKNAKLKGKAYRYIRITLNSLGRMEKSFEVCPSLADEATTQNLQMTL